MTTIRVRFHELDPYGHVNHAVYLSYFEQARVELLDEIGFGLTRLREMGFNLVVIDVHIRFLAPAYSGDTLVISSTVTDLRPASSRWAQVMRRDDDVIATNDVRAAITDFDGRPTRAPGELMAALRALPNM